MEIINWHGLTRLFYKKHCFFTTAVSLIKLKPCKSVPKTYTCLNEYYLSFALNPGDGVALTNVLTRLNADINQLTTHSGRD